MPDYTPYTPAAADALQDAYDPPVMHDPGSVPFDDSEPERCDALNFGKPTCDELLGLIAGRISSKAYKQVWTCLAGLNVGDPVRISANTTVVLALATTEGNADVVGFVRYKPTTTTCIIDHFYAVTGLTGLTANGAVYLTDAGAFSATPGTFKKQLGKAKNTTTAFLSALPMIIPDTVVTTNTAQTISARKTHTATDIFSNMLRIGTVEIVIQDATPATRNDGTALVADDLWYETDTNILWFWNGTYWLSTQEYQSTVAGWVGAVDPSSGSSGAVILGDHTTDVYLTKMVASVFHDAAQDGSNYWTVSAVRRNAAGDNVVIGTSFNTQASITINNYYLYTHVINTHVDTNEAAPNDVRRLFIELAETGTAGSWNYSNVAVFYRLAHL